MGKKARTKTLGSSIKAIQEAIANFIPVVPPICMHQSIRTHSFRDSNNQLLVSTSNFNRTSPSHVEDDACSSSGRNQLDQVIPTTTDAISSRRFYFSPTTSKSILEERRIQLGPRKIKYFSGPPCNTDPLGTTGGACGGGCFCEESVHVVIISDDPYRDFKDSMEEMVESHGLREFSELQQLLQCYLRLNDEKKHNIIMFSFIDLLMHHLISSSRSLASDDRRHNHR